MCQTGRVLLESHRPADDEQRAVVAGKLGVLERLLFIGENAMRQRVRERAVGVAGR